MSATFDLEMSFVQGDGNVYSARSFRRPADAVFGTTAAVIGADALLVEASSPNAMSIDVKNGIAAIPGGDGNDQGMYLGVLAQASGEQTVAIGANGSANPRIDLIVVEVLDPAHSGAAGEKIQIRVIEGTTAASPTPPSTPTSAIALAQVTVAGGAVQITTGDITDVRPHVVTPLGGMIELDYGNSEFKVSDGLVVNTNLLVADSVNGRVGIGKSVPTEPLDISGRAKADEFVVGASKTFNNVRKQTDADNSSDDNSVTTAAWVINYINTEASVNTADQWSTDQLFRFQGDIFTEDVYVNGSTSETFNIEISDGAIKERHYGDTSIANEHLKSDAVRNNVIQDGTITPAKFTESYYTESESDARYLGINAKAADSNKLDNIDSSQFLRSDQADTATGKIYFTGGGGTAGNQAINISDGASTATAGIGFQYGHANSFNHGVFRMSNNNVHRFVFLQENNSSLAQAEASAFITTSDVTLKTKTGDVPGLAFVNTLEPFSGHWNDKSDSEINFWLGAQEVQTALGEAGYNTDIHKLVDRGENAYGLDYTQLVPVLVKAVKELTARIEQLEGS